MDFESSIRNLELAIMSRSIMEATITEYCAPRAVGFLTNNRDMTALSTNKDGISDGGTIQSLDSDVNQAGKSWFLCLAVCKSSERPPNTF